MIAGYRCGRPDRAMRAPDPSRHERLGGIAGKLLFVFAAHVPLVGRLPDHRTERILLDIEDVLDRELEKEATK